MIPNFLKNCGRWNAGEASKLSLLVVFAVPNGVLDPQLQSSSPSSPAILHSSSPSSPAVLHFVRIHTKYVYFGGPSQPKFTPLEALPMSVVPLLRSLGASFGVPGTPLNSNLMLLSLQIGCNLSTSLQNLFQDAL